MLHDRYFINAFVQDIINTWQEHYHSYVKRRFVSVDKVLPQKMPIEAFIEIYFGVFKIYYDFKVIGFAPMGSFFVAVYVFWDENMTRYFLLI